MRTQVYLPTSVRSRLDGEHRKRCVSRSLIMVRALEEFFDRLDRQPNAPPFDWSGDR